MEHIVVAVGVRVRPGLDFGLRSTAKDKNQHEQARRCELPRANRSATGVRGDRISLANASRRILARPAAARGPLPVRPSPTYGGSIPVRSSHLVTVSTCGRGSAVVIRGPYVTPLAQPNVRITLKHSVCRAAPVPSNDRARH